MNWSRLRSVLLHPLTLWQVLQVKDDGIGISPEHLDKIWQRFYQVNQARQSDSGLGLGLSMVYQIIRLHNGQITATSTLGKEAALQ